MEKEFVPYELAVKLKALGFDKECFSYYDLNNKPNFFGADGLMDTHCVQVNRPTFSQAFRWFRDKRGLVSWISFRIDLKKKYLWYITDVKNIAARDGDYIFDILIESYEEAELACLKKLIVLLKANEQR